VVVVVCAGFLYGANNWKHTLKDELDELQQRRSIAWCGRCGNISVDGINFTRVEGGLECAGCGAVSPHFEYIRRSSLDLDPLEDRLKG
jgi:hypothetical protein